MNADKPQAMPVRPDAVPNDLKALARWVVWKYVEEVDPETGEVDYDKPPVNARTGGLASSTNPKTWGAFAEALAAYQRGGFDGIGFVLNRKKGEDGKEESGGLVGVDLDHCRNRETGEIQPWALEIIQDLDTYAEVSPSGEGVRLFLYGDLPLEGRKKGDYENYQGGRYVTVTAQHIDGAPATIEHRQEQLLRVHGRYWPKQEQAQQGPRADAPPVSLDDEELLRRAGEARNGAKFMRLWRGEVAGHNSASEADLALCSYLAFWCGPDAGRIDDLFRRSGLFRSKWNREYYRDRTIQKALAGRTQFYTPGGNGRNGKAAHGGNGHAGGAGPAKADQQCRPADEWPAPIPFDAARDLPPFPARLLPPALAEWVEAESTAKQTPRDLAAQLALAVCGAALATRFRVRVRDGWAEPTNLFTVVSLPPGERKSAVFADALAPVLQHEGEEQERMAPRIAEAASEHRTMEARLKIAEHQAAKAEDPEERRQFQHDAKELAKELAAHVVPEPPQMFCDDETPESLGRLIAKQGGRMLQAAAEGTAFEIVKGRYSESPNFDVYLKGHAGDPLRTGRVGRERDTVDCPALSVALAVQPDVIAGLAEQAMLRGRGFLARFLYAMPVSRVGGRAINAPPVPARTEATYRDTVLSLWRLEGAVGPDGRPAPHWLTFSLAADRRLQDFEAWLEPQMADGEDLSLLAGWAQKLAGAAARIAGVMHVAAAVGEGRPWNVPLCERTVAAAVELARDYYLPHAQAAFATMGADAKTANARHVWGKIRSECKEYSESAPPRFSRRDIHQWNRRRFPNVEELDPVLALLVDRYYLRPLDGTGIPGRGHASPVYEVSPAALRLIPDEAPRTHCTHRTHSDGGPAPNECSENSKSAPTRSETEAEAESNGYTHPSYDPRDNPFDDELAM